MISWVNLRIIFIQYNTINYDMGVSYKSHNLEPLQLVFVLIVNPWKCVEYHEKFGNLLKFNKVLYSNSLKRLSSRPGFSLLSPSNWDELGWFSITGSGKSFLKAFSLVIWSFYFIYHYNLFFPNLMVTYRGF